MHLLDLQRATATRLTGACVGLLLGISCNAQAASVSILVCDGQPIEVSGDDPEAMDEVCAASLAALRYFATLDMAPTHTIRIELTGKAVAHGQGPAYGLYDGSREHLQLMSLGAITVQRPPPTLFDRAIDHAMYAGLVTHELMHAVAQQHRRVETLGVVAQEYLAYAAQLATLPEPLRLEIVGSAGVSAWEKGDTISEIYLGLNVHRFAVKSYLHLRDHRDPAAFVQEVLSSRGWSFQAN